MKVDTTQAHRVLVIVMSRSYASVHCHGSYAPSDWKIAAVHHGSRDADKYSFAVSFAVASADIVIIATIAALVISKICIGSHCNPSYASLRRRSS